MYSFLDVIINKNIPRLKKKYIITKNIKKYNILHVSTNYAKNIK